MFKVKNPGKKIKEICAALGEPYKIVIMDFENVIYRNLGNDFDFEVSGLDNQKESFNAKIYIWDNRKGSRIIETITNIGSLTDLKNHLDSAAAKYSK